MMRDHWKEVEGVPELVLLRGVMMVHELIKMMVKQTKIEFGRQMTKKAGDDEERERTGKEDNSETPADAGASDRVDFEATGKPVCDKKKAIRDCKRSAVNEPWSVVRPSTDPGSLLLPESWSFSLFALLCANQPLAVDFGMISSSFQRNGQLL